MAVRAAVVASGVETVKSNGNGHDWSPPFWNKVLSASTEALLIDDFLLPVQMQGPRCRAHEGERRLLLAIVHQAWCDLHGPDAVMRDAAWSWFTRDTEGYLCNFHTICDIFDWERNWVIRRLTHNRATAPLFLVRRFKM